MSRGGCSTWSWGGERAVRVAACRVLLAVVAASLAAACGYRIAGLGGSLPGGVTRIEVPIFDNRTGRGDIGKVVTEDFIRELLAAGKVVLARGEEAEAVVRGTVTTYQKDPITFDAKQTPLENRLTVKVDIVLAARGGGRVLFAEKGVTVRQDFPVRSDLQENDRLEEEVLQSVSELMGQKLVSLMLEGF